jgi:hypothetical protein
MNTTIRIAPGVTVEFTPLALRTLHGYHKELIAEGNSPVEAARFASRKVARLFAAKLESLLQRPDVTITLHPKG